MFSVLTLPSQAEALLQRAVAINDQALGPQHSGTAESLVSLALCYHVREQYDLAEPLLQHALAIFEQSLGPKHDHTATVLLLLAIHYEVQNRFTEAESLYQRTFAIWAQTSESEQANSLLDRFIDGLRNINMEKEAATLEARVKATRVKPYP